MSIDVGDWRNGCVGINVGKHLLDWNNRSGSLSSYIDSVTQPFGKDIAAGTATTYQPDSETSILQALDR